MQWLEYRVQQVDGRRRHAMRMKRFLGQLVMIVALAAMTAGVMPAPTAVEYSNGVPNIHRYGEQSSIGNPFGLVWTWVRSFAFIIP
jgi:hypothetical protein